MNRIWVAIDNFNPESFCQTVDQLICGRVGHKQVKAIRFALVCRLIMKSYDQFTITYSGAEAVSRSY